MIPVNFRSSKKYDCILVNHCYNNYRFPVVILNGYFFVKDSSGQKTLQNGGIPQEGDLNPHLKKLEKDIDKLVDASFSGRIFSIMTSISNSIYKVY